MSKITLRNNTQFVAQYVLKKGQQIVARIPGIQPSAQMTIPTDNIYAVTATTVIDGNTYTSAPEEVSGSMGFLAQVLQVPAQGTYEFDVQETACKSPNTLQFQKTCISSVTFTITKDWVPLQNVVVPDSYTAETLDISDTFYVYAVINGVTTATSTFTNPSATVTATTNTSDLEADYFTLAVS